MAGSDGALHCSTPESATHSSSGLDQTADIKDYFHLCVSPFLESMIAPGCREKPAIAAEIGEGRGAGRGRVARAVDPGSGGGQGRKLQGASEKDPYAPPGPIRA